MAIISRSQLEHPALGETGGAPLHTSIDDIYQTLGDNSPGRYAEYSGIADTTTVEVDHNFGTNLVELGVLIYTGSGINLVRVNEPEDIATPWTIQEKAGSEKTIIEVITPSSGGPHTFAVVVTNVGFEHLGIGTSPVVTEKLTVSQTGATTTQAINVNKSGVIGAVNNQAIHATNTSTGTTWTNFQDGVTNIRGNRALFGEVSAIGDTTPRGWIGAFGWSSSTSDQTDSASIGVLGQGTASGSQGNYGVVGDCNNGTGFAIGGYFQTRSSIAGSVGLVADNRGSTGDIFQARDNGTSVFSVVNGGNVGIKIAIPEVLFHVRDADSLLTANSKTRILAESNGHAAVSILAGTTFESAIYMANATSGSATYAQIVFDANNKFKLLNNNGLAIAIDTSQNVGLKTLTPADTLDVSSGGVRFASGGTSLSHYEQGTFTPILANSGVAAPTSITYTVQTGNFTRIGNVMTIHCSLAWSAITIGTATGQVWIGMPGLPLALNNLNVNGINTGNVPLPNAASSTGVKGQFATLNPPGAPPLGTYLTLSDWLSGANGSSVAVNSLNATGSFDFNFSYIVA